MRNLKLFLFLVLFCSNISLAQIGGRIYHSVSGKPLANVNIVLKDTPLGAQSDSSGRFVIENIPKGKYTLIASRVGFLPYRTGIRIGRGTVRKLDFPLIEAPLQSSRILVESERWVSPLTRPHMSRFVVKSEEILNSAGSFEDPLKTVQSLPGVISRSDYTSNFYIRGSEPEQQAIVLDGLTLQNPYRGRALGYGSLSILNPDLVQAMDVTLGGYSAAYGNRLGALIELQTKDGPAEWKNNISLNLLSARYAVGGPLGKDMTVLFSARRTYYDWVVNKLSSQKVAYPHFYDIFGKVRWNFARNHILRVMAMFGGEGSRLANIDQFSGHLFTQSTNQIFYAALDGFLSKNFSYRILSAYQANNDSLSMIFNPDNAGDSFGRVRFRQWSTQARMIWEAKESSTSAGFSFSDISQGTNIRTLYFNNKYLDGKADYHYSISGFFLENATTLFNSLQLKPGLRWDYFSLFKQRVFSPRFNFRWNFSKNWSLLGSSGIFYQFPERFNTPGYENAAGTSRPTALQPQRSKYTALGLQYRFQGNIKVNVEAYRKTIDHLHVQIVSKTNPNYTDIRIDDIGKSESSGLEISANYSTVNLHIQPAYSFSKTIFRRSPTARWKPMYFDNKHWFTFKLDYRFLKSWQLHSISKFASGFPHRQMIGWSKSGNGDYSLIPTDRMIRAAYFRCDLRLSYLAGNWKAYIEVVNITNSRNFDQYLNYYYKESNKYTLQTDSIYMLPRLPVFGFQIRF